MSLAERTRQRPTRRTTVGIGLLVVLLVGGVLTYALWWSRPHVFGGRGNTVGMDVPVGQTGNLLVLESPYDVRTTLRAAKPANLVNSADADIDFVVCTWSKDDERYGASVGTLDRDCSSVQPLDDHVFEAYSEQRRVAGVFVRVTPRRAGVVTMDGFDLTYSYDWHSIERTGTEQVGAGVDLRVR